MTVDATEMRRAALLAAAASVLLFGGVARPVGAATPLAVHFAADTESPDEGPVLGRFVASGPAVDAGVMCPQGDVYDHGTFGQGFQSGFLVTLQIYKEMTCDDGSGRFTLLVSVRRYLDPLTGDILTEDGRWNVDRRSFDDYGKLHGSGTLVGLPTAAGIFHEFDGVVLIN